MENTYHSHIMLYLYHRLAEDDINRQKSDLVLTFFTVSIRPLTEAIKRHINEWIIEYGTVLHDHVRDGLFDLKMKIESMGNELVTNPKTVDQLKAVLQVLSQHQ